MLVSARFWEGNELEVLRLCQMGHLKSVISPAILDELAGVLASKFDAQLDEIDLYRDEIELVSELVFPIGDLDVLHEDPSDNIVLETALLGEADLIVTGDRHLLSLGTFQGIPIMRAAEVVRLIASR